jgi:hypothetical protein
MEIPNDWHLHRVQANNSQTARLTWTGQRCLWPRAWCLSAYGGEGSIITIQLIQPRFLDTSRGDLHVRNLRSHGGDVLVTRRRGDRGCKRFQQEAARSLGVPKIDDKCVVERPESRTEDDAGTKRASIFGQAVTSQHMLSFLALPGALPPGHFDDFWLLEDGTMIYREEYTDQRGPGEILVVDNGEYLQAETVDGRLVVSWSSRLKADEFFRDAMRALGKPSVSEDAAYVQLQAADAGEVADGAGRADDVVDYLAKERPQVAFARMDFRGGNLGDARVTWSAPAARVAGHDGEYVELSVALSEMVDRDRIFRLIGLTASSGLLANRTKVLAEIKQFAA